MYKAFYVIAALSVFTVQAEARPHHRLHRIQYLPQSVALQAGGERVVGSRPAGCPNRFCGCEASLYKFGRIIPGLNLASNWRRFPRSAPASGMAAVRSGHVMILELHIAGDVGWCMTAIRAVMSRENIRGRSPATRSLIPVQAPVELASQVLDRVRRPMRPPMAGVTPTPGREGERS